jgi:hypothetical protein
MKCPCGHTQCFICSRSVTDYSHFSQLTCPLYSDVTPLLEKEVAEAQEKTVQQILKNRGDLKDDDVRVEAEVNIGAAQPNGPQGPNDPHNFGMDAFGQQFRQLANIGVQNPLRVFPHNAFDVFNNFFQPHQIQPPPPQPFNPFNLFPPFQRQMQQPPPLGQPWIQIPPIPQMFPQNMAPQPQTPPGQPIAHPNQPAQYAPQRHPTHPIAHPNQPTNGPCQCLQCETAKVGGQRLGGTPAGPPPFAARANNAYQPAPPTPPATPAHAPQFDPFNQGFAGR